jgi:glycosyltransferase involved in cell wall biosynthesis
MIKKEIVILHNHLRRGGVTRIISSQIKGLHSLGIKVSILTGEAPIDASEFSVPIEVMPELNYSSNTSMKAASIKEQFTEILDFVKANLNENSLLHVHNLNLGKNPLVTLAVAKLAESGVNVFNHAHDFAEDRAENLDFLEKAISGIFKEELSEILYPKLNNYRFGVLNRFDYKRLLDLKVPSERIEFLPNPVSLPELQFSVDHRLKICKQLNIDSSKQIFVYPVRVIRRKNIGELILLAYLLRQSAEFIVTLPPQNPIEKVHYDKWLAFCRRNKINNIHFEAGTICAFDEIMNSADKCITTSIKEGFGMMYLEPWLYNKPVVGRNIDSVTDDFNNAGLQFSCLYDSIDIPSRKHTQIDFGFCPPKQQMAFIELIINDENLEQKLLSDNPILTNIVNPICKDEIKVNQKIIESEYSLNKYGARLNEIYAKFS